jgi:hypothetical protein
MAFGRRQVPSKSSQVKERAKANDFKGFVTCINNTVGLTELVSTILKR